MPNLTEKDINRFLSKINFTDNPNKCWDWNRCLDTNGYGQFHVKLNYKENKMFLSTRLSYFIHNGVDPVGFAVLHKCDNPKCCNPSHLFLGTLSENTVDMVSKGRANKPKGEQCKSAKLKHSWYWRNQKSLR